MRRVLFVSTILLLASFARAQAPASAPVQNSFDIVSVADGVYAAIGRAGIYANGAFIVNQSDVVVVDTHLRPSWAKDLAAEIQRITRNPVRYVVNTHWHPDHVQGNEYYVGAFGPTVEYLAQHNTRQDMVLKALPAVQDELSKDVPAQIASLEKQLAAGKDDQGKDLTPESRPAIEKQLADAKAYLSELRHMSVTLPTMTFEKSLVLHKPGRSIHLLYFGKGHTRGDIIVYLPTEKVVITGDLLTNGIPFMRDAYPVEWVGTLQSLRLLDWNTAVCGHGPVQYGKGQLDKLIAYMSDMVAAVKDARHRGLALEQAQKEIDLSSHALDFPNFKTANPAAIARTYTELSGGIKD